MSDSRNVVLVSIDSLRGDHCGFLGDDRGLTPTLDTLASEGVAYRNAIAPGPQTFSSMPGIFTGRRRRPTGLDEFPQASHWERRLAAIDEHMRRHASLAERLAERGYDTGAVTPNPWTSTASGFDRGFDEFVDFSETDDGGWVNSIADRIPGVDPDSRPVELVSNLVSGSEFFARWETLYDDIERVRESLSEPYFLWVFVLDTHFPFIPSRAHREEQSLFGTYYGAYRSSDPMRGKGGELSPRVRESVLRSYRDTVRSADAFVDTLRSDLACDDPALLVHSDHGESFGDHGNYGHHHREVYEENVRVPYLVHNAGVTAEVTEPTSLLSVHDAVLEIARDGTFDPAAAAAPYVFASSECGTNRAMRGVPFKRMESCDAARLFDLDVDPDERSDISAARPGVMTELGRRLERVDGDAAERERIHDAARRVAAADEL
jgi:arylsulfatase